ncbi:MAG: PEP-CTERM sorting domain-containing protein [Myxococcota bacterium]|nr:PEP-CTERM sorting domain-containing protein [Myxococcota bacterium]
MPRPNPVNRTRRRRVSFLCALTLLLPLGLSIGSSAQAAYFTLSDAVVIDLSTPGNVNGVLGTLLPVGLPSSLSDPVGITAGSTSLATHDVIVFALSLSAGSASVDALGAGAFASPMLPNPMGAGAFNNDPGTGLVAPGSVAVGSFTTLRGDYNFSGDTIDAGETTVNLFVTYSPLDSALALGNTVNFTISSGTNFTVQSTLIPEPGTFVLVATGLGLLAARRRRQRA